MSGWAVGVGWVGGWVCAYTIDRTNFRSPTPQNKDVEFHSTRKIDSVSMRTFWQQIAITVKIYQGFALPADPFSSYRFNIFVSNATRRWCNCCCCCCCCCCWSHLTLRSFNSSQVLQLLQIPPSPASTLPVAAMLPHAITGCIWSNITFWSKFRNPFTWSYQINNDNLLDLRSYGVAAPESHQEAGRHSRATPGARK